MIKFDTFFTFHVLLLPRLYHDDAASIRYKRQQAQANKRGQASFESRKSSLPGGYDKVAYAEFDKTTNAPTKKRPSFHANENAYYGYGNDESTTQGYGHMEDGTDGDDNAEEHDYEGTCW